MTSINGKTVLITGANRGIGRALIDESLTRGAARVYAGTRQAFTHSDSRVVPVTLDVTDHAQVAEAASRTDALDILINNAGVATYDDLTSNDVLQQHFAVNVFGPLEVTRAFLPLLTESGGAVIYNISLAALAPLPIIPSYSASKAAAFSVAVSLRALLAERGVSVHVALTGPTDTDMTRDLPIPKATRQSVAAGILDGVAKGEQEIFPDVVSASMAEGWRKGVVKILERENAASVAA